MEAERKSGKMQNLVRRVVTKKRSRTTIEGPPPLAASSPKRGFLGMPRQRPPTQIDPELIGAKIRKPPRGVIPAGTFPAKGMKARMYFPEQSHGKKAYAKFPFIRLSQKSVQAESTKRIILESLI